MKLVPQEQVQQTAQLLLAFLDSENVAVPGNLVEGIVNGKGLLRGLLSGSLVVAQPDQPAPPAPPAPTPEPAEKVAKKVAKKKAA